MVRIMSILMFIIHAFGSHAPMPTTCLPNEHHSILVTGGRVHCMECDLTVIAYV